MVPQPSQQEGSMSRPAIRLLSLTLFLAAQAVMPALAASGLDPGAPDPMRPAASSSSSSSSQQQTKSPTTAAPHRTKKAAKQSFLSDPAFIQGYHSAYTSIYDRHDYAAAIEELKTLGHDDYANVANLIGYSYRKLGDYKLSQAWYERALKSDPNHVLTWNYYGMWQIEQGNREQAEYHLSRIADICGTDCYEYRSLAAALEQPPGTGLVY
jgi:tetratricopeptide (TPR) repeat protein